MPGARISGEELTAIANEHGWRLLDIQENIGMCSYSKVINGHKARINVYRTKMTVTTYLKHNKTGKNQLYRKNVSMEQLHKIFKNPRTHTGTGYRRAS